MGYAITWFAVKESNAEDLLQRLHLRPNGETKENPESLISTAKMKTGWRVLWYDRYTCPFIGKNDLMEISKAYEIVMVLVEEHVMSSSSELWCEGTRRWYLSHEGDNGPKGLTAIGHLPACFNSIRAEMEKEQEKENQEEAEVDYLFEIPLLVAQNHVGFKHDENCDHLMEGGFIVLEGGKKDSSKSNVGFFARLFSRN